MTLSEYLQKNGRGTMSRIAEHLGLQPSHIKIWADGQRETPSRHCFAIEKFTQGEVTRRDLRPDDWQLYWPELDDNFNKNAEKERKLKDLSELILISLRTNDVDEVVRQVERWKYVIQKEE